GAGGLGVGPESDAVPVRIGPGPHRGLRDPFFTRRAAVAGTGVAADNAQLRGSGPHARAGCAADLAACDAATRSLWIRRSLGVDVSADDERVAGDFAAAAQP